MKDKSSIKFTGGKTHSVTFRITESMVKYFVELTGDHSSLHVDEAFARRSEYRHNVVHGMLPVVFIISSFNLCDRNSRYQLYKMSARFIRPVFVNDILNIETNIVDIDNKNRRIFFEYVLKDAASSLAFTIGSFVLAHDGLSGNNDKPVSLNKLNKSMLINAAEERDLLFEQIQKNDENSFDFIIRREHLYKLYTILFEGEGIGKETKSELAQRDGNYNSVNLLATTLLSTFVGMCIPGKYAAFMDFQITFFRPVQLCKRYTLTGRVEFKSQSTTTLVESIEMRDSINNVEVYASGKINVKVNRPPILMPGINFIKESAMDLGLKNKVALITGGSRGIGETTAKLFSLYGCRVAVNYSKGKNDADRVVSEINHNGGEAVAVQADVSDREQVKRMVSVIRKSCGNISILVNNAVKDFYPKAFMELTWKDFQGEIDVTLKGAFNCCQEILPLMMESKEGKIINVVTVATDNPPPNQAKYVASKSALVGLTRSLAIEFASCGIQVNMVSPSIVETDLTKHIPKMFLDGMKNDTPMKRNAEAIDVAKAIIFLASNLSPFITGQKIMVTGGAAPFL